jgi:HTH-type transcriptional repressor of puuD
VADVHIIECAHLQPFDRGSGVSTVPYIGQWNSDTTTVTTGTTTFPPGTGIPLHTHNVDETVLILEGRARATLDDSEYELAAGDATQARAGVPHRFENVGETAMRIYWVYSGRHVTRTICATGETFVHLSEQDRGATSHRRDG